MKIDLKKIVMIIFICIALLNFIMYEKTMNELTDEQKTFLVGHGMGSMFMATFMFVLLALLFDNIQVKPIKKSK